MLRAWHMPAYNTSVGTSLYNCHCGIFSAFELALPHVRTRQGVLVDVYWLMRSELSAAYGIWYRVSCVSKIRDRLV